MRDDYFRAGLLADPVWDMLLDLMAARLEGRKVSVSSLCFAAAVPPTTALRWINTLTGQGLLLRDADPEDGRRVHLKLSERTARAIGAWLRRVRQLGDARP
jgi:DNA-binding MarR family transcriptional regulator